MAKLTRGRCGQEVKRTGQEDGPKRYSHGAVKRTGLEVARLQQRGVVGTAAGCVGTAAGCMGTSAGCVVQQRGVVGTTQT